MKGHIRVAISAILVFVICISFLPIGSLVCHADEPAAKSFEVSVSDPVWGKTGYSYDEFSYNTVTVSSDKSPHINVLSIFVENGYISYLPEASSWSTDIATESGLHQSAIRVFSAPEGGAADNTALIKTIIEQIRFKANPSTNNFKAIIIADGQKTEMPTVAGYTVTRGKNNHYYVFVPDQVDWDVAYAEAKKLYFMERQGYLVTITSKEEDQLLDSIALNGAWAGGARVPVPLTAGEMDQDTVWAGFATFADGSNRAEDKDTVWKWVCGPEVGTAIKITKSRSEGLGVNNPEDAQGSYSNWNQEYGTQADGDEPNNWTPGEYCLSVHYGQHGEQSTEENSVKGWNDLPKEPSGQEQYVTGYFVEFDGVDYDDELSYTVNEEETYSHEYERTAKTDADGNVYYEIKCTNPEHENCAYKGDDSDTISISIKADDKNYDSTQIDAAVLSVKDGDTEISSENVSSFLSSVGLSVDGDISYSGTTKSGAVYGPSTSRPALAGTYTATQALKIGEATTYVSQSFEINKVNLTVELADQGVLIGNSVKSTVADAVKTSTGLKGTDAITQIIVKTTPDPLPLGEHDIEIDNSKPNYIVIKNGDEDVTSNYNISFVNGKATVGKRTPVASGTATGSEIHYGQKLSDSTVTGTVKDAETGATVEGTFEWKVKSTKPDISDSNSTTYEVTFTPTVEGKYISITLNGTLPVVQKNIADEDINKDISLDLKNSEVVSLHNDEASEDMTKDSDYTVTSVREGDKQKITITGIGRYTGSKTVYVDRHKWTGRIVTQTVVDTSASELSPAIREISEENGTTILLDKIKSPTNANETEAKVIVNEIAESGSSSDGDFNALISLRIKNTDATVTDEEKSCAQSAINPGRSGDSIIIPKTATIGMYFDLGLDIEYRVVRKTTDPETELVYTSSDISDTSGTVYGEKSFLENVRITVPQRLRPASGYTRTYYIIRVHDEGAGSLRWDALPVTRSGYDLSFNTDKFSTYALAYTEVKEAEKKSDVDTGTGSSSSSSTSSNSTTTTSTVSNSVVVASPEVSAPTSVQVIAPKTGESFERYFYILAIIAGLVMLALIKREEKEGKL